MKNARHRLDSRPVCSVVLARESAVRGPDCSFSKGVNKKFYLESFGRVGDGLAGQTLDTALDGPVEDVRHDRSPSDGLSILLLIGFARFSVATRFHRRRGSVSVRAPTAVRCLESVSRFFQDSELF